MKKGQSTEKRIKNILKFLKMNENTISTLMGGVVIVVIAGLIFNYFRTANLKTWQGILLNEDQAATTTEKKDESANEGLIATYKVEKGDDLWHIAEKYYKSGYNYVDIMKENKITGKGTIVAGQELRIPKVEAKKLTVIEEKGEIAISESGDVVKAEVKGNEASSLEPGEYVTVKGDSYWKIAVRAYGDGYKWTKIYWANKNTFSNPDFIYSGVKIVIPALEK